MWRVDDCFIHGCVFVIGCVDRMCQLFFLECFLWSFSSGLFWVLFNIFFVRTLDQRFASSKKPSAGRASEGGNLCWPAAKTQFYFCQIWQLSQPISHKDQFHATFSLRVRAVVSLLQSVNIQYQRQPDIKVHKQNRQFRYCNIDTLHINVCRDTFYFRR